MADMNPSNIVYNELLKQFRPYLNVSALAISYM